MAFNFIKRLLISEMQNQSLLKSPIALALMYKKVHDSEPSLLTSYFGLFSIGLRYFSKNSDITSSTSATFFVGKFGGNM